MDKGQIQHDFQICCRAVRNTPPWLLLANFCLILIFLTSFFILRVYEPPSQWHETSFVLAETEYRAIKGGAVLDLYTTDGRRFVLNRNDEEIRNVLKLSERYYAVYSDDYFHDIIQALEDEERVYLDLEESMGQYYNNKLLFTSVASVCLFVLVICNGIYVAGCIREERQRMRVRSRKRNG